MSPSTEIKTFRVAEIFGPTIQGEGRNVGMPCYFIRFGGCDFRCTWCDTPHAVLPEEVAKLKKMSPWDIFSRINYLGTTNDVNWIVITGGNPGLLDLGDTVELLQKHGYKIMVETQGTTYRPWYNVVDEMCFSPKPPSSGNITPLDFLERIFLKMEENLDRELWDQAYLKVPIFCDDDLDYAEEVHARFPDIELFLSIGNTDPGLPTVGNPHPDVPPRIDLTREYVLDQFRLTVETVLDRRPLLQECKMFPQQHTLLWGNARGR